MVQNKVAHFLWPTVYYFFTIKRAPSCFW